ncbi:4-alpha-glucanotransferase [Microgenomates group bacterium]|nr:4-alpha-glucanotransferase [Microgenomates group bacterium]
MKKNYIFKIVGTSVPLSALTTKAEPQKPGSFSAGLALINWLGETQQKAWQLLPLHETQLEPDSTTQHVSSPYKSYGIGLGPRFLSETLPKPNEAYLNQFYNSQQDWLKDYALFCALRDYLGTDNWTKWEMPLRTRDKEALNQWQKKLNNQINKHQQEQGVLHYQYSLIRNRAKQQGILLIGDLAFYLPANSPLVWVNQHLFDITRFSGLPNGPKAHFGRQVWGHPLYLWQTTERQRQIIELFKLRLTYLAGLFDWVRLDHAKGFYFYGVMDATDPAKDKVKTGPGSKALKPILDHCQKISLKIFAEDSGDRLKGLRRTLIEYKIPGIRVFRYSLMTIKQRGVHPRYAKVAKYPKNCLATLTTHDTETLMGYLNKLTTGQCQQLAFHTKTEFDPDRKVFAQRLRQAIIDSPAFISLISIQDWLLTTDRINVPGTETKSNDPNWHYQLKIPVEELTL